MLNDPNMTIAVWMIWFAVTVLIYKLLIWATWDRFED